MDTILAIQVPMKLQSVADHRRTKGELRRLWLLHEFLPPQPARKVARRSGSPHFASKATRALNTGASRSHRHPNCTTESPRLK